MCFSFARHLRMSASLISLIHASMKSPLVALILVLIDPCISPANAWSPFASLTSKNSEVSVLRSLNMASTTPSSQDLSLTTDPIMALMQMHSQARHGFSPSFFKEKPTTASAPKAEKSKKKEVTKHNNKESVEEEKGNKQKNNSENCGDANVFIGKSALEWTNPQYPSGETGRMSCLLQVKRDPKIWQEIVQIKVIIVDLNLAQPDEGACKHDNITLHGSDLQGQEAGRGLQLCGQEPRDYVWSSGQKYPQHKHLYLHFPGDKDAVLSFQVNLSPSKSVRRWNILLKPILLQSPERAPFGCMEYYFRSADKADKTQEYHRVVRSLNYPMSYEHGMIDKMQVGICFGVADNELPITAFKLSPDAGDFRCDSFRLGKPEKSGIDSDCKHSYFLLPYSAGSPVRVCGAKHKDTASPIILKHSLFPRIEYHSSREKGGFRFIWDYEMFKCHGKQ